jgi:hypothetical protein
MICQKRSKQRVDAAEAAPNTHASVGSVTLAGEDESASSPPLQNKLRCPTSFDAPRRPAARGALAARCMRARGCPPRCRVCFHAASGGGCASSLQRPRRKAASRVATARRCPTCAAC